MRCAWDGGAAAQLGTVHPAGSVASPAVLADGRTVRIADEDGAVHEWDTSSEHAAGFACRIVGRSMTEAEWNAVLPSASYQETCPGA